jgi:hypothetical protein
MKQLVQGSHYFYTEALLAYQSPDIETFKLVFEYMETHLALTCRYMNDYDVTFQRV